MSQFTAITWKVREGTEAQVAELFRESGRPHHEILDAAGNQVGTLLTTVVFMHRNQVVRVIEFEGALPDLMRHMAQQEEIKELEAKLDEYLEVRRDTSSPEKFREYFLNSLLTTVMHRRHDDVVVAA